MYEIGSLTNVMDLRTVNNVLYVQCTQRNAGNKCDDEMIGVDNV